MERLTMGWGKKGLKPASIKGGGWEKIIKGWGRIT
jgi:hypothetical protein